MRIAYITETYPPQINGASLAAARAVHHLRRSGHTVELIRPRQRFESARRDDDSHEWRTAAAPIPLTAALRFGLATVSTLRKRWQQERPHLVHAATPGPLAWAALRAARAEGIATTADARGNACSRTGWLQPVVLGYLRRLHAMADCTFVPSGTLGDALRERGFGAMRVIGHGVDCNLYSPARRDDALRDEWGAAAHDRVLLAASRLAPEYNVGLALAAFECLRLQHPRLRMVVVGDGPLRRRFESAHPRVRFVGAQRGPQLARTLASADVYLHATPHDAYGQLPLEVLASGLAVAAFYTATSAVLVEHGRSGWLAAAGDEAGYFDAVRRALADAAPDGALRMRARGAALKADWESQLRSFEQGLRAVYEAAHGRRVVQPAVPA